MLSLWRKCRSLCEQFCISFIPTNAGPPLRANRTTLAPILFNPAGCSQIMAFFLGGAYFCGLWETCNSFFFLSFFCLLFPHAKPFIALGDVKFTGCLQQCHETKGLPTEAGWDTTEPEPLPSPCPLTLHSSCPHPKTGIRAFPSFNASCSEVSSTRQVFSLWRELCVYASVNCLSDLLASEPEQQYQFF